MKNVILSFIAILVLVVSSNAQIIEDTNVNITIATIRFSSNDSSIYISPDTSSRPLWQTGYTKKKIFTQDTNASYGIMTDTTLYYPINANKWFILKVDSAPPNMIIDMWHEYQTDSGKDGGIVEFSTDSGMTWMNVIACSGFYPSVQTENFYTARDTLVNGNAAFTGNSKHQILSRFQFFNCMGEKSTSRGCNFYYQSWLLPSFYIRFRFMSDSNADTLSGWKIDSLRVINSGCSGAVRTVAKNNHIQPYPNPAHDGLFYFDAIDNEKNYTIAVYNAIGQKLLSIPYTHLVDISHYPNGMYFYNVSNGRETDTGKLLYY